jgi:RimJ/RimL family protein N-acetyltransferase
VDLAHHVTLKDGGKALIRQAAVEDAEQPLSLLNTVGHEEVYIQTEGVEKTLDQERDWINRFDGLSSILIIATLDGKLVGSADFRRGSQAKNAHVAELGIAIQKESRGQGLGRAMLEDGLSWARSVGVRKLFLGVFGTNERAVSLYRGLGFAEEGRLRGQVILRGVPDDLVLMSRWL